MSDTLTKVNILNMALDYVGQAPISSIDPASSRLETVVARHYDPVRRALLREYMWNFAKARAVLARSGTPEFDYTDAFTLPADCVRVISITDSNGIVDLLDYDIQGRDLYIDAGGATALYLRYVKDTEEISEFDPIFVQLLALRLALKLAYRLSLKKGLVDQLSALIGAEEIKAVTIDGQERPPKIARRRSDWLSARNGGDFRSSWRFEP